MRKLLILFLILSVLPLVSAENQLLNGLVSYWDFDNNFNDSMDRNPLSESNTVHHTSCVQGTCRDFPSNSAYAWTSTTIWETKPIQLTINFWLNPDSWSDNDVPFSMEDNDYANLISYGSDGGANVHWRIRTDSTNRDQARGVVLYPTGVWTMLTFRWNGSRWVGFVNGTEDFNITAPGDGGGGGDGANPFSISANGDNPATWGMDAKFDEFGIWNTSLTNEQITALWNSGSGLNFSSFDDGIPTSTIPTHSKPILNSSLLQNRSIENLTLYNQSTTDADGDAVFNIVNWYKDGSSPYDLYFPLENESILDYSGNDDHGTNNGGTKTSSAGWNTDSRYYDFTTDVSTNISFPDMGITGLGEHTWSFWFRSDTQSGEQKLISFEGERDLYIGMGADTCDANELGITFFSSSVWRTLCTDALNNASWFHATITYSFVSDVVRIYLNGTLNASGSDPGFIASSSTINTIGLTHDGGIDEFIMWDSVLSQAEITALIDGYTEHGYNAIIDSGSTSPGEIWRGCITPTDGEEDGVLNCSANLTVRSLASIDLLFAPEDDPVSYRDNNTFGIGEDWLSYINWTDYETGLALNDSVGNCSPLDFQLGMIEEEADNDNFTIGSTGDFTTYTANITFHSINNSANDTVYFFGCHEGPPAQDMTVSLACVGGNESWTIDQSLMPNCDDGFSEIRRTSSVCANKTDLNITVSHTGSRLKNIVDFTTDRTFDPYHRNLYPTEITFNATTQLWQLNHIHEQYTSGIYYVNATCTHDTDSGFDITISENITINNTPPIIFFNNVNNSLGETDLDNNSVIEYSDGIWDWSITVNDPTGLDSVNVTIYNASGGRIYSSANGVDQFDFNTSDALFKDFDNPYILSVTANDTSGLRNQDNITFIVNDTVTPSITPNYPVSANTTIQGSTLICLNWTAQDPALYSMQYNITNSSGTDVGNNLTSGITGTNNTLYECRELSVSGVYDVLYEACDGHTGEELIKLKLDQLIDDGNLKIMKYLDGDVVVAVRRDDVDLFNSVRSYDRYNFDYTFPSPRSQLKILIGVKGTVRKVPNSDYLGHFVINDKYWIDFENPHVSSISFNELDPEVLGYPQFDKIAQVTIDFDTPMNQAVFNSIGELNCRNLSVQFEIDATAPTVTLTSPANNSIQQIFNNTNITLTYTATDSNGVGACYLYINGTLNQTNTTAGVFVFDPPFTNSSYSWYVVCTDTYNNNGTSDTWIFNTTQRSSGQVLSDVFSCGDKILDSNYSITLAGDNTQGCSLRQNEYLVTSSVTPCTLTAEGDYFFGQNEFSLIYDNGSSTICEVWYRDVEFTLDDLAILIVYVGLFLIFLWLGAKTGFFLFSMLGAIMLMLLGFQLFVISWLVGAVVILTGLLLFITSFL